MRHLYHNVFETPLLYPGLAGGKAPITRSTKGSFSSHGVKQRHKCLVRRWVCQKEWLSDTTRFNTLLLLYPVARIDRKKRLPGCAQREPPAAAAWLACAAATLTAAEEAPETAHGNGRR